MSIEYFEEEFFYWTRPVAASELLLVSFITTWKHQKFSSLRPVSWNGLGKQLFISVSQIRMIYRNNSVYFFKGNIQMSASVIDDQKCKKFQGYQNVFKNTLLKELTSFRFHVI